MDEYGLEVEELETWYAIELAKLECKHTFEKSLLDCEMAQKKLNLIRKYKEVGVGVTSGNSR